MDFAVNKAHRQKVNVAPGSLQVWLRPSPFIWPDLLTHPVHTINKREAGGVVLIESTVSRRCLHTDWELRRCCGAAVAPDPNLTLICRFTCVFSLHACDIKQHREASLIQQDLLSDFKLTHTHTNTHAWPALTGQHDCIHQHVAHGWWWRRRCIGPSLISIWFLSSVHHPCCHCVC